MNLSVSIRLGLGLSVRVWAPFAAGRLWQWRSYRPIKHRIESRAVERRAAKSQRQEWTACQGPMGGDCAEMGLWLETGQQKQGRRKRV